MVSHARSTGHATAVYDPVTDRWITPGGYSSTLSARCLWIDHAAAAAHAETVRPLAELVMISVDLTVDVRDRKKIDEAAVRAFPGRAKDPTVFKGA